MQHFKYWKVKSIRLKMHEIVKKTKNENPCGTSHFHSFSHEDCVPVKNVMWIHRRLLTEEIKVQKSRLFITSFPEQAWWLMYFYRHQHFQAENTFFLDIGKMHAAVITLAVVATGRGIQAATARLGRVCFFTGRIYAVICSAWKYTTSFWNLTLSPQITMLWNYIYMCQ